jgi:hypothetical protein
MSVVNMFGFEQLPIRPVFSAAHMAAEGYPLLNVQLAGNSYSNVYTVNRNGTTRLRLQWLFAQSSGGGYPRGAVVFNRTGRELFGNPSVVTKGVLGFRIYIDAMLVQYKAAWSQAYFVLVDGTPLATDQLQNLSEGEHFIETEFDYANKVINTYINSTKVGSTPLSGLTLDSSIRLGAFANGAGNNPTIFVGDVSDIYLTYDNQNGEPSGRLGPVRVRPLEVDEATLPSTWTVSDPDAISTYDYPVYGGAEIFKGHRLLPPTTSELPIPGVLEVIPSSPGATMTNIFGVGSYASFAGIVVGTPVTITAKFARPKKVSAYALQSFAATWGFFNDWILQASNDGTTWTDLDTRTGLGAYFNNSSNRMGAFKLTPAKIGWYTQYRIRATTWINHSSTPSMLTVSHFQLLGDLADVIENAKTDIIARPFDTGLVNSMDTPVIRTGTDESSAEFGFKVPSFGLGDIMAVQVGLSARRDSGGEEKLLVKTSLGDIDGAEKTIVLQPHTTNLDVIEHRTVSHRGQPWTRTDLDNLKVIIKSKTGA